MNELIEATDAQRRDGMLVLLEECYVRAVAIVDGDEPDNLASKLGDDAYGHFTELARTVHAARGVALTLAAYKAVEPSQDIRAYKSEFDGGFSARSFDTAVTIPFLISKNLSRSVETHWLT